MNLRLYLASSKLSNMKALIKCNSILLQHFHHLGIGDCHHTPTQRVAIPLLLTMILRPISLDAASNCMSD